MDAADVINILAVLVSPVVAVLITLWHQTRKEDRDRKDRLFTVLMINRKAFPPTQEFVGALNLIDLVFADVKPVTRLWHEYYGMLASAKTEPEFANRDNKYLEMLSAMAKHLGYEALEQFNIEKFYIPQAHIDQHALNFQTQQEWLRVLQNTNTLHFVPKEESSRR